MKFNKGKRHSISIVSVLLLLGAILSAMMLTASAESMPDKLYVGGFAFGVRFGTDGVLVTGTRAFSSEGKAVDPAGEAGIKAKDVIKKVNGKDVFSAKEISEAVNGGDAVVFTVLRDGKTIEISVKPICEDHSGVYRLGIDLKDSMAGIGTVTYVCPETLEFGALGHGICDGATGVIMPIRKGSAMDVGIGGVVKGKSGKPGEIKGHFLSKRLGSVRNNTECGVFGVFTCADTLGEPIPIGHKNEVKEGKAVIRTTLGDDGVKEYEIEISKINRESTDNKSFLINVTDKALKDRTGGIIQGMSGSPIIQDGKLVGAVTHVMVNDPTTGYGIFIENMLNAANMPMQKAA